MKSLMVQGTTSGSGKTTLVTALCRIFSDMGYKVAPFKSQNMSNFSYSTSKFEISRAQAIQAIAARCTITPDLNPILLKPLGNYYSQVFLMGEYYKKMHASDYYSKFVRTKGLAAANDTLKKLQKNYDLVILEGAGSPVEINLQQYDIANMLIAMKARASVILISDIDKGGSFASIVGTLNLLEKKHQKLIQGFVFNKFRGDVNILKSGFKKLQLITKKPVLGTIPKITINLPEEDSLNVKPKKIRWNKKTTSVIDKEINVLTKVVKKSLNIKTIEKMIE